jgi:hypothetical protein
MTIHQILNMSSTIVTSGAGMLLCNLDLSPVFSGICIVQSLVFFVVSCVFQSMFFCQLYCRLFFNLPLLTTPLVSNFFSWINESRKSSLMEEIEQMVWGKSYFLVENTWILRKCLVHMIT